MKSVFSFTRSHQTWSQKVSSKDWTGQPGQHRHVQEARLPGGERIRWCHTFLQTATACLHFVTTYWDNATKFYIKKHLFMVLSKSPGKLLSIHYLRIDDSAKIEKWKCILLQDDLSCACKSFSKKQQYYLLKKCGALLRIILVSAAGVGV